MPILLHQRILVRECLQNVRVMSEAMQNLAHQLQANPGKIGILQVSVAEYLKLVAEARRIEYIVVSLALSEKAISLRMPEEKDASTFRASIDVAINTQLNELDNESVKKIIIVDESDNGFRN